MSLGSINLNLLVPLNELLRTQSVSKAAQNLHLSQSAMSATLARLRQTLNDPVLVRVGREMVLTPHAETLIGPVADLLTQVEELLTTRAAFDPTSDARSFTVVASDYTTLTLIRPLLERLAANAPAVRLSVLPLRDDFADHIRQDDVDLLLVSRQFAAENLQDFPHKVMFRDRFVACGWSENTDFHEDLSTEEFLRLRFVQYVVGERPNLADAALDRLGTHRHIEIRTESQLLVPYLVTSTPLVGMVPERLATAAQGPASLRLIDLGIDLPEIREAGVWHPRRSADPGHQWFVRQLEEVGASLQSGGIATGGGPSSSARTGAVT